MATTDTEAAIPAVVAAVTRTSLSGTGISPMIGTVITGVSTTGTGGRGSGCGSGCGGG